jgi:hypothetical protein
MRNGFETATEVQLKLVPWRFFVTLTWKPARSGSVASRNLEAWEFFRHWCQLDGSQLALTPIALRWERGELSERPHAHALIAGLKQCTRNVCFRQNYDWNERRGIGIARVRLYEARKESVEAYLSKGLGEENRYELRKFDKADRLVINAPAWKLMLAATGNQTRTRQHVCT